METMPLIAVIQVELQIVIFQSPDLILRVGSIFEELAREPIMTLIITNLMLDCLIVDDL